MAIPENLCWEILDLINTSSVPKGWVKDGSRDGEPIRHTIALVDLEYELVLRHRKGEIEDCLYFLEKRRYILPQGFKGMTRVTYSLTNRAKSALAERAFDKDEQSAFQAAVFDATKPGWLGMKLDLSEVWRRTKKKRGSSRSLE